MVQPAGGLCLRWQMVHVGQVVLVQAMKPLGINRYCVPINRFKDLPAKDIIRFIAGCHERDDIGFEGLYVYSFLHKDHLGYIVNFIVGTLTHFPFLFSGHPVILPHFIGATIWHGCTDLHFFGVHFSQDHRCISCSFVFCIICLNLLG